MPRPYCGGKSPGGRRLGTEAECSRHGRAFGRRLLSTTEDPTTLAALQGGTGASAGRCGKRRPAAAQETCARQVRLYGVLPAIDAAADLHRRSVLGTHPPAVPSPRHPYSASVLAGTNAHSRDGTLLFVSVVWAGLDATQTAAAAADPTRARGGVGYAFGYFVASRRERVFHVVQVYVNPAYRRGPPGYASQVSSWVLAELVAAVRQRAREDLYGPGIPLVVRIDPNAPCFQMGNPHHMSAAQSDRLEAMYLGAGFARVSLEAVEGRGRRTAELRTTT